MSAEQDLNVSPTEVEIGDAVAFLNNAGLNRLATVVRRLAFQRDQLKAEVARLSDRLNNQSDEDVADAGRVVKWNKEQTKHLRERLAGTAVIHYAPYGVHHEVYCGASCAEVGYTGDPRCVTCEACRAKSPGLFGNFSQDPTK